MKAVLSVSALYSLGVEEKGYVLFEADVDASLPIIDEEIVEDNDKVLVFRVLVSLHVQNVVLLVSPPYHDMFPQSPIIQLFFGPLLKFHLVSLSDTVTAEFGHES